jgi:phosphosulfolactate synthase (CoM biosynthesis protein A)
VRLLQYFRQTVYIRAKHERPLQFFTYILYYTDPPNYMNIDISAVLQIDAIYRGLRNYINIDTIYKGLPNSI